MISFCPKCSNGAQERRGGFEFMRSMNSASRCSEAEGIELGLDCLIFGLDLLGTFVAMTKVSVKKYSKSTILRTSAPSLDYHCCNQRVGLVAVVTHYDDLLK